MLGIIGLLVLAVVIATVVWLLLSKVLGPIILTLKVPLAGIIGNFFVEWGWTLGVLAGLWYFFSGVGWIDFPGRRH